MITAAEIRKRMRINNTTLDTEIQENIDTCLLDMKRVGINTAVNDKLVDKACELYCKAEYDYQGKGAEYEKKYEKLRDAMSLCSKYRKEEEEDV